RTFDLPNFVEEPAKADQRELLTNRPRIREALALAVRDTAVLGDGPGRPHVAGLGGTLFPDHLVTVELAGVLRFVALISALAIARPKPPVQPATSPLASSSRL